MSIIILLSLQGNKHKGKYQTIISDEDADLAQLRWNVTISRDTNAYTVRSILVNGKTVILKMHRIILGRMLGRELEKDEQVDHIDGNGLNNQRDNLRLASHSQNQANIPTQRNNKSGFKGVYRPKHTKKWIARIYSNGKYYNLGYFDTPELAAQAYAEKAKELNGEFANSGHRERKE